MCKKNVEYVLSLILDEDLSGCLNENIAKLQDILAGPPNVKEGEITLGKIYQEVTAKEREGDFVRVVFAWSLG